MNRFASLAGLMFVVSAAGCGSDGPEVGTVSGTVKIDGNPMAGVRVNFMPEEEGRPSSGVTDESGEYELAYSAERMGAALGAHTVSITPPEPTADAAASSSARWWIRPSPRRTSTRKSRFRWNRAAIRST